MKAGVYCEEGPADVIKVRDFPVPIAKDGEVVIRMLATSLNPVDFKLRAYPMNSSSRPLPFIPCVDFCGIVTSTHMCSDPHVSEGDIVFGFTEILGNSFGALASIITVREEFVASCPHAAYYDDASLAALPLVGSTVIQAFKPFLDSLQLNSTHITVGHRAPKKRILIQGGAGGLGSYAIQYAKNCLGMHVVTTCRKENFSFVRKLGADVVIDYKENSSFLLQDSRVQNMDIVFDPFAYLYRKDTFNSQLPVLGKNSHYIHIACSPHSIAESKRMNLSDPLKSAIPEASISYQLDTFIYKTYNSLNNLMNKFNVFERCKKVLNPEYEFPENSQSIIGNRTVVYDGPIYVHPSGADMRTVAKYVREGKCLPVVSKRNIYNFNTSSVIQAFKLLESGHSKGKIAIQIAEREEIIECMRNEFASLTYEETEESKD